ncbi:MAG: hypothetical protein ACE5KM_24210, partial [Planctomycetaceae bacterium]
MKRVTTSPQFESLLRAARRIATSNGAEAILILAEVPYDFAEIVGMVRRTKLPDDFELPDGQKHLRLVVASDKPDVQQAARADEVDLIPLLHEPQTRQIQISQAIIDGVAEELLRSGSRLVALYAAFERDVIDSLSTTGEERLAAR